MRKEKKNQYKRYVRLKHFLVVTGSNPIVSEPEHLLMETGRDRLRATQLEALR